MSMIKLILPPFPALLDRRKPQTQQEPTLRRTPQLRNYEGRGRSHGNDFDRAVLR